MSRHQFSENYSKNAHLLPLQNGYHTWSPKLLTKQNVLVAGKFFANLTETERGRAWILVFILFEQITLALRTLAWLPWAAKWSGAQPWTLVLWFKLAPRLTNICTRVSWPCKAAMWRGAKPALLAELTLTQLTDWMVTFCKNNKCDMRLLVATTRSCIAIWSLITARHEWQEMYIYNFRERE